MQTEADVILHDAADTIIDNSSQRQSRPKQWATMPDANYAKNDCLSAHFKGRSTCS